MKEEWKNIVISGIGIAVYVAPNAGKAVHKDRPLHGLVLNDESCIRDYCFSDGTVMRTEGGALFYLPKHSSYEVKTVWHGGCYAINFDADIEDVPFCARPKSVEFLKRSFKTACDEWRSHSPTCHVAAMRALYDCVYLLFQERKQNYLPYDRRRLILPALEAIESNFTDRELTVAALAALCGMSEVYFRRIFAHSFSVSPKEYIVQRRLNYARQLLALGEFEVCQIAELCGYSEPCHFSRAFKKKYGISPKDYHSS